MRESIGEQCGRILALVLATAALASAIGSVLWVAFQASHYQTPADPARWLMLIPIGMMAVMGGLLLSIPGVALFAVPVTWPARRAIGHHPWRSVLVWPCSAAGSAGG